MSTKYPYRYIARMVVEAETPLAIGTGDKDLLTDFPIALDENKLPYIPGTALAGVLKHSLKESGWEDAIIESYFGTQADKADAHGSILSFTDAKMIGAAGKVLEGLRDIDFDDKFYRHYQTLPIRQHVRISDKGTAVEHGKFDEQVVIAGTRFCFEIELMSEEKDSEFEKILNVLYSPGFRIGSGTRSGFGKLKITDTKLAELDLQDGGLDAYINKPQDMEADKTWSAFKTISSEDSGEFKGWTKYELRLKPEDFFMFGAGIGDDDADDIPVKATKISWYNGTPKIDDHMVLIPATSIKGAISHRIAYHYNKEHWLYSGSAEAKTGEENPAVLDLFGKASDNEFIRGKVILSDIIIDKLQDRIFNHVTIDRYTGGAYAGALFQEKTTWGKGMDLCTQIYVSKSVDTETIKAFEAALDDLCQGLLPLGGMSAKGHGIFSGEWTKSE